MTELIDKLKTLQADTVTMYFQAHGYHWNVEGILFPQMHDKYTEIYEDVYGFLDDVSENLRKLGAKAPFQLGELVLNRRIGEVYSGTNPKDQIESLLLSNDILIEDIAEAYKAAEAAGEIGISADLEVRDGMHKKWKWQLTSTLKATIA